MACLSQEERFLVNFRNNQHRLMFSGLTAIVGLIVSFSMMYVGGPTAHHLPGAPFHIVAFLGAGAAGWFCLRAFGLNGWQGPVCTFGGGLGITLLGAVIGSWICVILTACDLMVSAIVERGFQNLEKTMTFFDLVQTLIMSPVLGGISIIDAAESLAVLLVWGLGMAGLHVYVRRLRTRWPVAETSQRKDD